MSTRAEDEAHAESARAAILAAFLDGRSPTEVEVLRGLVQWIGYDGWQIPDRVRELARLYGGDPDGGPWEPPPAEAAMPADGQAVSLPPLPPRTPLPPAEPVFDRARQAMEDHRTRHNWSGSTLEAGDLIAPDGEPFAP